MMLDVARHGGEERPVSLGGVAERTDLSRGYLEQVALALRNARLLRGVSGRQGGYKLATPAREITIGEVLEATIGPINLVDCIDDSECCPRSDSCECRVVYTLINSRIAEILQAYTLADLLDPSWVRKHNGGPKQEHQDVEWIDGHGCNPMRKGGQPKKPH